MGLPDSRAMTRASSSRRPRMPFSMWCSALDRSIEESRRVSSKPDTAASTASSYCASVAV